jgi:hypothetical protein
MKFFNWRNPLFWQTILLLLILGSIWLIFDYMMLVKLAPLGDGWK